MTKRSPPPRPLYEPKPAAKAPAPANPPPPTVGWGETASQAEGATAGPDVANAKKAAVAAKSKFKGGKMRDRSDKRAPAKKRRR